MTEKVLKEHGDRIAAVESSLHQLEVKLTKIESTAEHIKGRIDNGMSSTITKIWDKLSELAPSVKDNTEICAKVKLGTFWIVVTGLIGGLFSFMWNMFKSILLKNGG